MHFSKPIFLKTLKNHQIGSTIRKHYAKHLLILYNLETEEVINGEMKNVRLFHDDTFQSFFRRMDMSPDGQLLVIPSGVLEIDGEATVKNCTYVFSRTDLSR